MQPSGKGTLWSSLPKAPPIDEAAVRERFTATPLQVVLSPQIGSEQAALRELFTVKAAGGQKPTAAPAGGGAGGSAVKKEQQPALLDVKRSNQIQIALAKFKGRGILAAAPLSLEQRGAWTPFLSGVVSLLCLKVLALDETVRKPRAASVTHAHTVAVARDVSETRVPAGTQAGRHRAAARVLAQCRGGRDALSVRRGPASQGDGAGTSLL